MASKKVLLSALLAGVALGGTVKAAVITSETSSSNQSGQPVSSTDLINGLTPIDTNYTPHNEGGPIENFTNGTTQSISGGVPDGGLNDNSNSTNAVFDLNDSNWHATYILPTAGAPNGYDITSFVSTTGHQDNRAQQSFDVLVSTDNMTYTSLSGGAKFTSALTVNGGSDQITGTVTGVTGIKYVEFLDQSGGGTVYREFDVNGTPSAAPEPATLGMLSLGALALLARRRRAI